MKAKTKEVGSQLLRHKTWRIWNSNWLPDLLCRVQANWYLTTSLL